MQRHNPPVIPTFGLQKNKFHGEFSEADHYRKLIIIIKINLMLKVISLAIRRKKKVHFDKKAILKSSPFFCHRKFLVKQPLAYRALLCELTTQE